MKLGATDAAALDSFKNQAHSHRREQEMSSLFWFVIFSGCYNFGKIIKIDATRCHSLQLKCAFYSISALPQTPLGQLTALPQTS